MDIKKKDEWFKDETFWDQFAPIMFDEQRWAEVPAVADGIEALYTALAASRGRAGKALAILDQCCGLGRLTVELALRGHRLTGVDITPSYLEAARESAADEGLTVELIQADVRHFVRPTSFDLVLNLYTSFGYFADPADDKQVSRNAYDSLSAGGLYIIETLGKEIAVRDFTEGEWFERSGAVVLTEYEALNGWEFLKNRWILLKNGERFERSFNQRLYASTELQKLLLDVGFTSVFVFGGWDKRSYDQKAQTLIVVGRK
ncbi:class I SAM-dependent methyltransferase [Gracilinema caldarium]|uniref:class I SAM-dependent methyltransferase n=1 Tax=Gracilinema caldarium TaxID=215591 RepID=UPI0026F1E2A1|nr:class I SAM-dependent methyltransferase [Gracilinema caldarium]